MSGSDTVEEEYRRFESFLRVDRGAYDPRRHRLARMRRLLAAFGDPHLACPVVHVAGSKGKGSTAAFLGSILHAAGRRCGVYSSPHVESYRERVRVLDGSLSDETALDLFDRIRSTIAREFTAHDPAELPTTFELLTLFGFLAFRAAKCDVAVVEVGIGGRLDATNLVRPVASVITPIELEHTDLLGTTLRSIAGEKSGIVKRRTPVFVSQQAPEALAVIRRVAELRQAPLVTLNDELVALRLEPSRGSSRAATGFRATYRDGTSLSAELRLLGRVQAENAALAALVASRLGPPIARDRIEAGLSSAWLPGRAELVPASPPVLLDGAHTGRSVRELCRTASQIEPDKRRRVAVFGAVRGKHHEAMLLPLIDTFDTIVLARPGTFKESDSGELASICARLGGRCIRREEPAAALAAARDTLATAGENLPSARDGLIVVTGSFYLVGEIRVLLHEDGGRTKR